MEPAAAKTKKLGDAIEKLGESGADASGDLNKTAAALEKVEAAEEDVVGASQQAASALGGVGQAAVESSGAAAAGASGVAQAVGGVTLAVDEERAALLASGADAVDSGAVAEAALDGVADAAENAADEARDLGKATEKAADEADGFKDAVRNIEAMAEALRKSDLELEVQRQGFVGIITEVEKLVAEEIQRGAAGRDNANIAAKSLVGLRGQLADVNAEIKDQVEAFRNLGAAGGAAGGEGAAAQDLVAQRIALAEAAVKKAQDQFVQTGRISKAAVNEVSQTIESLNIAIENTTGTTAQATDAQVAAWQKLKIGQTQVNETANRLTNATKDNSIALQESGTQISAVTGAIAGLYGALGKQQTVVSSLAGQTGNLAQSYQQLKSAAAAMNLNTLSASASTAALTSQFAAFLAVAAAAATAGLKVANANEQNREATDGLWKGTQKFAGAIGRDFLDTLSGWQYALQSVYNAQYDVKANLLTLGTTEEESKRATKDLVHAFNELAVSAFSGQSGVKLYNIAIRDGLKEEEARSLAIENSASVLKFYEASLKAGAEGQELWTRGLRESKGETAEFITFIQAHNAEMKRAATLSGQAEAARKTETEATLALRIALDQLDQAFPDAQGNTAAMNALADAIDEAAGKVRGLTKEERERLDLIVELLRRGDELNDSQKKALATLVGMARAGKDASGTLNTLVRLQIMLQQATNGGNKSLAEALNTLHNLSGAWDLNSQAIKRSIAEAQNALDNVDHLTAAQRRQYQTVIDGFRAMDAARAQSAQLESARIATLVTAEDELTRRGSVATAAIRERLADLANLIPMSATYGGVLKDLASQLQQVTDGTVTLSAEDRGRLEVIIELTSRGAELTASQQAFAVSLINSALAADKATLAGNALAKIHAQLDYATNGTTQKIETQLAVIAELTKDWELNELAIRRAVEEYDNILKSTDGLTAAQVRLYGEIVQGIKRIDELTKTQTDLKISQEELLDTIAGGTREQAKAAYAAYAANEKEIFSIQGKIEATKAHTEAQAVNLQTLKDVTVSTTQLVKTGENSWTNIGTAQKGAADSANVAGDAAKNAATKIGDASKEIAGATGNVEHLGTSANTTADSVNRIGSAASDAASELSASSQKWVEDARRMAASAAEFDKVKRVLQDIENGVTRVMDKFNNLPKVIEDAAARSAKASGYASGKVQESG